MRLKRGILVLAVAAVVAAVMSGCPGGGGSGEPPPDPDFRITLDRQGTHNLGAVFHGYQADVLLPFEVTVTNAGAQATGQLSIALGGSTAFAVSPTVMVSIAAGSTGRFTVMPVTGLNVGTHSATVTVSGQNNINASFVASFTVNERPPRGITLVGITGGAHDFPALLEEYAAHALTPFNVVVRNIGLEATGDLTVAVSSDDFEATVATIPSLAVDAEGGFAVSPIVGLTEGLHSAMVTVSGTAGLAPVSFDMTFRVDAVRDIVPDITDPVLLGIIRQAMNIPAGPIYNNQAALVDEISASTAEGVYITSLAGLQHFTGLEILQLPDNHIEEINFAFHPLLRLVQLSNNHIRYIDIRGLAHLEVFIYDGLSTPDDRRIHEFLLGNNQLLRWLDIPNHQMSAIDLRAVPSLQRLIIRNNVNLAPDRVDVTGNPNLIELNVNVMHWLDLPAGLTTLDLTQNPLLRHLEVAGNPIATLDLTHNTALEVLWMNDTNVTEIAFAQLAQLREVHANHVPLGNVDFSENHNLEWVEVTGTAALQFMFPDSNPNLLAVIANNNQNLTEFTINDAPNLLDVDVSGNLMNRLTLTNNPMLEVVLADLNDFGTSDNIDFSGSNAILLVTMGHHPSEHPNLSMTRFDTGILPPSVETFFLTGHRQIEELDFANLPNLVEFQANRIGLTSLDLTGNPKIEMWRSLYNNISGTVDLTQNPELWNFWSTGGNIQGIQVTGSRLGWTPDGFQEFNVAVDVTDNIMTSVDDVVGHATQNPPLVFSPIPGQGAFMFHPQRTD